MKNRKYMGKHHIIKKNSEATVMTLSCHPIETTTSESGCEDDDARDSPP